MIYQPNVLKRCRKCNQYLLATTTYFFVEPRNTDWLYSWCRACKNARKREIRQENPDQVEREHAYNRKYGELHRQQLSDYKKNRRQSNLQEIRQRERYLRQINKDRIKEQQKRHRSKNRDKGRIAQIIRRERRYSRVANFTYKDWRNALEYFHGGCAYCGNPPSFLDTYQVLQQDHFVPFVAGGEYTYDNIIPACQLCNQKKSDTPAREWLVSYFGNRNGGIIYKRIIAYFEWVKAKR